MAALLDTPSRVLKRVQQYEEMELPSLPSFQRDDLDLSDDYDPQDSVDVEAVVVANHNESEVSGTETTVYTPQANRQTGYYSTPHVARGIAGNPPATTTTARTESTVKPSTSSPSVDSTPMPLSRHHALNNQLDSPGGSFTDSFAVPDQFPDTSEVVDDAETQHAYEDYSSLSERLPAPAFGDDLAYGKDGSASSVAATPVSGTSVNQSLRPGSSRWPIQDTPKPLQDARVPSLSRSELSATDNEATTPEGRESLQLHGSGGHMSVVGADESKQDPAFTFLQEPRTASRSSSPSSIPSTAATPIAIRYMDQPSTAARAAATPFGATAPLRDVTPVYRNQRTVAPGMPSTSVDYATSPRAPLDDVARRKSHVLSVLASASLPSRVRSRPTPLRHDHRSASPQENTASESSEFVGWRPRKDVLGGDMLDGSVSQDMSGLSLASSNDSTSDGSAISVPFRRGNTSVPDILLANGVAASGSNLRLENRPDAVRIHKHLNMMNQQLLDTNADLAREAEDWRGECRRLINIVRDAGIEVDDQGLAGDLNADNARADLSAASASSLTTAARGRHEAVEQLRVALREKDDLTARLQLELEEKDAQLSTLRLQASALDGNSRDESAPSFPRQPGDFDPEVLRLQSDYARKTEEHARQFTEICADFEHQVQALKDELGAVTAEASSLRSQLAMAKSSTPTQEEELHGQIAKLGSDLAQAQEEARAASEEMATAQRHLSEARANETAVLDQLSAAKQEGILATSRAEELHQRLLTAESQIADYTRQVETAQERLAAYEDEKSALQTENIELARRVSDFERRHSSEQDVVDELRYTIQQLSTNSESRGRELLATQQRVTELESQLLDAQRAQSRSRAELESIRNQLSIAKLEPLVSDPTGSPNQTSPSTLVAALEERLDEAYRQIGTLKAEREATPARMATLEARDTRIQALETEKEALLERLKAREMSSPARWANSMRTSTPMMHKAISALRSPRTPGPLKDVSSFRAKSCACCSRTVVLASNNHRGFERVSPPSPTGAFAAGTGRRQLST